MKYVSVAVDGPAGAGKSSVSKAVGKDLGFTYVDTGAMYRAVALFAIENDIDIKEDGEALKERLDDIKIDLKYTDEEQRVYLNGRDVSDRIRSEEISMGASCVAVIPEVREKLVSIQREMARTRSVIMDGRDICTSVLPDADVKIFLTASSEARAKRRYNELREKGVMCDRDKIRSDIEARDKNDSERKVSPLTRAKDAVLVDTTDMTFEESVQKIKEIIDNVL